MSAPSAAWRRPAMTAEDIGRMAWLADPSGAHFAVITSAEPATAA
ncbi:VOC family protein [Streptomyces milbemycinicus]|uniref:VOC family protein n=1 Tax=Streptomyces milbemycinicus TaxID=476552 RepID=A0ABW8LW49_9ACTN